MTQIRIEYLRWITVYLWNSGIAACDHKHKEFRLLNYCSYNRLRMSVLEKLRGLTPERVMELRQHAFNWIIIQDQQALAIMFDEFDNVYNKEEQSFISWRNELRSAA